mgnify:CR=1 FL=1
MLEQAGNLQLGFGCRAGVEPSLFQLGDVFREGVEGRVGQLLVAEAGQRLKPEQRIGDRAEEAAAQRVRRR